ncbi:replication stress response regulator SDE2 isoform X2 [Trachypithecus francoisi]|uniref:replication stress response regulator SDE2 isoform X2 n=1 Tax=Trachypithecus francoisi TaxID=54180 RepID=UPI00141B66DA|nr:replication stress response regulator SDE2 isoform X2 [Trachypithecus francoisi]
MEHSLTAVTQCSMELFIVWNPDFVVEKERADISDCIHLFEIVSLRMKHGLGMAAHACNPSTLGGQSFGSMLRALGAQIEKTTNREACRDLSGRRLRDVNHEKAMAEWVKQQAEREAEKEQKRLERLQRKLVEPKHCFTSPDYQQQCHEMAERLEDSVLKGMQAASSKMVSAEISENRKRQWPTKSKTDRGASAGKRRCFWLGMEGLETAEGSSSESSDDDSEEAPSTSGLGFHAPKIGSDGVEMAAKFPSSSQRARVVNTDRGSLEQLHIPVTDSGRHISEDLCAGLGESKEHMESGMVTETEETQEKKAESKEPIEEEPTGAGLNKDKETKERTDGERVAEVAPEERENVAFVKLQESQLGDTVIDKETIDLLAFSSVAELELLGLEKLKCELIALGLKCGGTLQERAARLFSVRGLAKEQIDPALFAKPLKGKKK